MGRGGRLRTFPARPRSPGHRSDGPPISSFGRGNEPWKSHDHRRRHESQPCRRHRSRPDRCRRHRYRGHRHRHRHRLRHRHRHRRRQRSGPDRTGPRHPAPPGNDRRTSAPRCPDRRAGATHRRGAGRRRADRRPPAAPPRAARPPRPPPRPAPSARGPADGSPAGRSRTPLPPPDDRRASPSLGPRAPTNLPLGAALLRRVGPPGPAPRAPQLRLRHRESPPHQGVGRRVGLRAQQRTGPPDPPRGVCDRPGRRQPLAAPPGTTAHRPRAGPRSRRASALDRPRRRPAAPAARTERRSVHLPARVPHARAAAPRTGAARTNDARPNDVPPDQPGASATEPHHAPAPDTTPASRRPGRPGGLGAGRPPSPRARTFRTGRPDRGRDGGTGGRRSRGCRP